LLALISFHKLHSTRSLNIYRSLSSKFIVNNQKTYRAHTQLH